MKIVFLGSPEFARHSLKKLYRDSNIELALVISQPPRKKGRGQQQKPTPVGRFAREKELKLLEIADVNSEAGLSKIERVKPDYLVVVAFGQILKAELLKLPRKAAINLHASLLPKYRGASPINQALIEGEEFTGVTTMLMDEGLDTGDILLQRRIRIEPGDTAGSLHDKLAQEGADLLLETLLKYDKGQIEPVPQNEEMSSYAPRLSRDDGRIDFNRPVREVYDFIRGNNPWPGAFTGFRGQKLKVWQAKVTGRESGSKRPGSILKASPQQGLLVATADYGIKLTEVQLPGKKRMSDRDFVCGYQPEPGERLELN